MYKWQSSVGLHSDVIFDNKNPLNINCEFIFDLNQSKSLLMSTAVSSVMIDLIANDHQWIPSFIVNDNNTNNDTNQLKSLFDNRQLISSITSDDDIMDTLNTLNESNQLEMNEYRQIDTVCVSLIDSEDLDDDRYLSLMSDLDFSNEYEKELRDRIMKHKKTSSCGFSSLQRRIEKVKHDLLNLTNKLNTNYPEEKINENGNGINGYYNLGLGEMVEDSEVSLLNNDNKSDDKEDVEKSWKCPSQFNAKNPFSELSESTQKILGRLNLKEEETTMELEDPMEIDDEEIEMEEDELEFTFSNRPDSFLNAFMNKGGVLPIIEEEEEEEDSSSDESESAKSTVIERCIPSNDNTVASKSASMHSFDVTDSESYVTPLSSFRVYGQKQDLSDDTEEYYSDFAKCSVSSHGSRESLKSQEEDKGDGSCTERTIKAEQDHYEQIFENGLSLHDKSNSSTKDDDEFASEAEYDNSGWSTEDIPQSVEQSDSLYDKPYRSMLKSSLPDLLESSDNHDIDNLGTSLIARHFNKSTDLDEVLNQIAPYKPPSNGRLSQSLCNLFTTKSNKIIRPDDFFQERASFDNLLETDLDSGYVSIYKPVKETEILPKVDFSVSMGNVSQVEASYGGYSVPFIERLRKKAGSVSELRIADSLTKLNIPNWLNLHEDDNCENLYEVDKSINNHTLPIEHSPTSLDRTLLSSQRRMMSLPRPGPENCNTPVIKHHIPSTPVVLPSQMLRQNSQKKLMPIQFCQARKFLLPNKVFLSKNKEVLNV